MVHNAGALRFREPGLAAEPGHVAIGLPSVQLPRIDDLLPFGQQETQAELVTFDGLCRFFQELLHHLPIGDGRLAAVRPVEPQTEGIEGMDVDAFGQTRFVAH